MRVRGLSAAAGLLAAIVFALGAKQTVHLQHWNFAASCAWWPWMLAGLDAFARTGAPAAGVGPPERGRGRWLLLTAVAAALSWLGGAAQMAYFGTLVAGAHARRARAGPLAAPQGRRAPRARRGPARPPPRRRRDPAGAGARPARPARRGRRLRVRDELEVAEPLGARAVRAAARVRRARGSSRR